jgi:hypothetical protein
MKAQPRTALIASLGGLALALAACDTGPSPADQPCERCDEIDRPPTDQVDDSQVPASPCDGVLVDRSGRTNADGSPIQRVAGRLGDPLAVLVYQSEGGCPTSFEGIVEKLARTDAEACLDVFDGLAGMQTRVVSEQAQLRDTKEGSLYRTVTSRACGGRPPFELLFASFGVSPDSADIPPGVEIMAFDREAGVFNFYKEVGDQMVFFGDSIDYITQGPGGPGLTDVRGCANCHTGGGVVMKELLFPWVHWEDEFDTPGAFELVENRRHLFGEKQGGRDMEELTMEANRAWNRRRVAYLVEHGTVEELLRPLFCPVEVNIASLDGFGFPTELVLDRRLGFMFLEEFAEFERFQELAAGYQALLEAIDQRVPGHPGERDTVAEFSFIQRAHADTDYVDQLIESGVIDEPFARDVLLVDFTRPVFSDDRCDLLAFAPELPATERSPASIRQGFIAALEAGPQAAPARQLLDYLRSAERGEPSLHPFALHEFTTSCNDRLETVELNGTPVMSLVIDAIKLRSLWRKLAFGDDGVLDGASGSAERPFPVFEFEDSLATDAIEVTTAARLESLLEVHPKARLSPSSCALIDRFEEVPLPQIETFGSCVNDFSEQGVCIDTAQVSCPGFTESGLCPGSASVLCCLGV